MVYLHYSVWKFGGSKDHTPVIRGGNLQGRRSRGKKPWLSALCDICTSLLVECGCHLCQLLVKIQMDMSYASWVRRHVSHLQCLFCVSFY